jgi:phosphoribosyl 1,2-cyclic phosphodiesterase
MRLAVIGSGSKGNGYVLYNEAEALVIEAGCKLGDVLRCVDRRAIVGVAITHEHGDHAKYAREYYASGLPVLATAGTHDKIGIDTHSTIVCGIGGKHSFGGFTIYPFDVVHDAAEPCGFVIEHEECGRVLFLTDTHFSPYTFEGLNQIIIEANYCPTILERKKARGDKHPVVYSRIERSHMSIDTTIEALLSNDLTAVNNIVLIHLSDSNSDEQAFFDRAAYATGKRITIADAGVDIPFNIFNF